MARDSIHPSTGPRPHLNPYLAGVLLGLVLLGSFLVLGVGLGASAGIARISAFAERSVVPGHVADSAYFGGWGESPLSYYLVFMFAGTLLGGLTSAIAARRIQPQLERGPTAPRNQRIALAAGGGVLVGFASRLASGCTSGQGLTGGAMLASGSLLFLGAMFLSGFAAARLVRRQWQ